MCIVICTLLLSRPARGAWVEILILRMPSSLHRSRPARGAWVEMFQSDGQYYYPVESRPARGAWVEMECAGEAMHRDYVAPRKGRVG